MTAAKRRAIDQIRRNQTLVRKTGELGYELSAHDSEPDVAANRDDIDDDLLRLMCVACHPVLSRKTHGWPLTLKLLGGLTTVEIARAFLTSETTMA